MFLIEPPMCTRRPDAHEQGIGAFAVSKPGFSVTSDESVEQDAEIFGVRQAVAVEIPRGIVMDDPMHHVDEVEDLVDARRPGIARLESVLDFTDDDQDGMITRADPDILTGAGRHLDGIECTDHRIGDEDHEDPRCQPSVVGDANLELMQYGLHESCLLTSGVAGSETRPFSVWSGDCESPFATTFRHKTNYVDLTGAAKIRWAVKTSGFHQVRPVVKLADGTMLVGETAAASVPALVQSEVPVAAIRWITLDPERVVTMGRRGGAFSAIWVPEPDLSRVDEVGFVDLMPASGHGTGGYIHVSEFQVYGNPVAR